VNNEELLQRFLTETGKHISGDFSEGDTKRIVTKALEWASERLSVELRGDVPVGWLYKNANHVEFSIGERRPDERASWTPLYERPQPPSPRVADEYPVSRVIEHANHLAKCADEFIQAAITLNNADEDHGDDLAAICEKYDEDCSALRDAIYEYQKRAERLATPPQDSATNGK